RAHHLEWRARLPHRPSRKSSRPPTEPPEGPIGELGRLGSPGSEGREGSLGSSGFDFAGGEPGTGCEPAGGPAAATRLFRLLANSTGASVKRPWQPSTGGSFA